MKPHYTFDNNIAILKLFPGMSPLVVENLLKTPQLKGVVMETFGSGNAPSSEWFLKLIREATDKGIVIVNITQCHTGSVEMGRYKTGHHLLENGVISGYDSTTESAVTKLMFLFGSGLSSEEVKEYMQWSILQEALSVIASFCSVEISTLSVSGTVLFTSVFSSAFCSFSSRAFLSSRTFFFKLIIYC